MAGTKINDYGVGDVDLTSLMETVDDQRTGFHAVSLTNYGNTTVPAIAAGSKIEVNGALFEFGSDETITGSPSNGTVYIKTVPSVSSITAEFTNTPPTWDDEKQGWYESATNNRYLNFIMTKSGSNYIGKEYFSDRYADIIGAGNGKTVIMQAIKTSTQVIADAVNTKITWDSEQIDTHSAFSSNTFTCPKPGYYQINSHIAYRETTVATTRACFIFIYKNGSPVSENAFSVYITTSSSTRMGPSISHILDLDYGDTIEIYAYGNGNEREVLKGLFSVVRIT
ncbi:MAG: hypothetical protein JSW06_02790 [Thermoplasmatales archaeon]|nr:MAG: hypothetical protein JSW06_02790 [Thermoplasmatales archaeon]